MQEMRAPGVRFPGGMLAACAMARPAPLAHAAAAADGHLCLLTRVVGIVAAVSRFSILSSLIRRANRPYLLKPRAKRAAKKPIQAALPLEGLRRMSATKLSY